MLVALTGPRVKATWRKSQLRRPSRAHARYSNDREFSTRQHAGKSPSVLKGNRKRIGKKAAQSNAERSGARGRLTISTETPLNAQGSRTPYESAARQEASPQIMRRSIRIATGPQTAKHATGIVAGPQAHHRFRRARQAACRDSQAKRKPPDIMAHRATQRRGGGFRYVRE